MLSDLEKGYLAGFIDGEGSLTVNYDKRRGHWLPRCDIVSTSTEAADYVCALLTKCGVIYSRHIKTSIHKPLHRIAICRRDSLEWLMREMQSVLVIKKEHAYVIMAMLLDGSWANTVLVSRIRELNRGSGKVVANKDAERIVEL